MIDFGLNFIRKLCQINIRRAAFEFVFDLRARKMVQHHLHHGEFVKVGIEQGLDNHGASSQKMLSS
jgi:hypothetical protein